MTSTRAWMAMRREFRFPPGYEWDAVKIDKVICHATSKYYFAKEMNQWNSIGCPAGLHPGAVHKDAPERPVPQCLLNGQGGAHAPAPMNQHQYNVGGAAFTPAPMRPPHLHQPHFGFPAGPASTPAHSANRSQFTHHHRSSTPAGLASTPAPMPGRQFGVNGLAFTPQQQMGSAVGDDGQFTPLAVPAAMDPTWRNLFTSLQVAEEEDAKFQKACQNWDIDWNNLPAPAKLEDVYALEKIPPEWLGGNTAFLLPWQREIFGIPEPSPAVTRVATRVPVPTHVTAPGPVVAPRMPYPTPESPFPKFRTPSLEDGQVPLFSPAPAPEPEPHRIRPIPMSDFASHSDLYRLPTPV